MSYTTIKAIYPRKKTESIEKLGNSYGSGPIIWKAIAGKYLGITKAYDYPGKGWMQLGYELWDLWKSPSVPIEHRIVFMFTFDRAYVSRKNYQRVASSIRKFLVDFPPKSGTVNHWSTIASLLESKPKFPGIGLYLTSVSDDPFLGQWNEEKEDYDPPNWNDIYEFVEQIDALDSQPSGVRK